MDDNNEVSILLEILDLEYLKPILIDRFQTINQLTLVNLNDIGIQNQDDINKLQYAINDIEQNKNSLEQYDPILSLNDSNHIITRIENETNLISSSLNLLLNNNYTNLPNDDATSDIDYILYKSEIDQIENHIQQIENNVEELIEHLEIQYPQLQESLNDDKKDSYKFYKQTFVILTLSMFCIGLMFYIKHK
ncbi:unnamed protein product [Rotaria sordida]|uniref:Uncharacterized protein n=1 Tax=Rotaria sordida TaxID=392033 RepID=A0A813Y4D9_9BILA|nr:unnamed protein product [Rotaria sordida]CAF0875577.1 unnamed protein product [Rotaria sordida]CAF0901308.1 unnamed protein product [Rotaria sordida]CAF0905544.1 unnamed protein product [Rotaria sordida]CAF0945714.1 unnamed protein product [Rotaria sordida]